MDTKLNPDTLLPLTILKTWGNLETALKINKLIYKIYNLIK